MGSSDEPSQQGGISFSHVWRVFVSAAIVSGGYIWTVGQGGFETTNKNLCVLWAHLPLLPPYEACEFQYVLVFSWTIAILVAAVWGILSTVRLISRIHGRRTRLFAHWLFFAVFLIGSGISLYRLVEQYRKPAIVAGFVDPPKVDTPPILQAPSAVPPPPTSSPPALSERETATRIAFRKEQLLDFKDKLSKAAKNLSALSDIILKLERERLANPETRRMGDENAATSYRVTFSNLKEEIKSFYPDFREDERKYELWGSVPGDDILKNDDKIKYRQHFQDFQLDQSMINKVLARIANDLEQNRIDRLRYRE